TWSGLRRPGGSRSSCACRIGLTASKERNPRLAASKPRVAEKNTAAKTFPGTTSEREPRDDRTRAALQVRCVGAGVSAARREVGVDHSKSAGLNAQAVLGHRVLRIGRARRGHDCPVEDVHKLAADEEVVAAIFAETEVAADV